MKLNDFVEARSALYPDMVISQDMAKLEELPSFIAFECAIVSFSDVLDEDNQ